MGLFDKKYCDICGEKIGLLGNRKLEDGNCCKDCAAKLSPWMTDRRQSTVQEIRQHLAYREENARRVPDMRPNRVLGNGTKVYIDEAKGQFFVTRYTNWQDRNPDIIGLDQVSSCKTEVKEHKSEIYTKDAEGKSVSYNPKRYEYEYEFRISILVNSPYFSEIEFELTDDRPEDRYSQEYINCERQAEEIRKALDPEAHKEALLQEQLKQALAQGIGAVQAAAQPAAPAQPTENKWFCPNCGQPNTGNFCSGCGTKRPVRAFRCDKCGWVPDDPANPPRFCPQCGDPFNENDRA